MKPSEYFELDRPANAWPKAAPNVWPYTHRTMAQVAAEERESELRKAMHRDRIRQDAQAAQESSQWRRAG